MHICSFVGEDDKLMCNTFLFPLEVSNQTDLILYRMYITVMKHPGREVDLGLVLDQTQILALDLDPGRIAANQGAAPDQPAIQDPVQDPVQTQAVDRMLT